MADMLMRAQCTVPLDSLIPQDAIVNTFYFDGDDFPGATEDFYLDGVMSLLTDFYHAVDGIFPSTVGSQVTVKIYNMRDAEPRQPMRTDVINITPSGDPPLPNEVALCLSFSAALASGQNPARRRGRVFIGPIKTPNAEQLVGSQSRPTDAILAQMAFGGEELLKGYNTGAPADSSVRWAIYSPTLDATGSIDDAFNDVHHGWVDDSWDTQRRRGAAPTKRELFDASTNH